MTNQRDWKKLLKADPTDWLLEPDDPGPRYLALRDLVEAYDAEIAAARRKAHREGPIATILAAMNPEGWWVRPGPGYGPKFRSTVWSVISLAQLGASDVEDKRISIACAYYLDHAVAKGGQITYLGKAASTAPCLQGNMLTALPDLGCQDSRLDAAFEWMARTVTGDGLPRRVDAAGFPPQDGSSGPFRYLRLNGPLFRCSTNDDLPCAWAGTSVLKAFSRLPLDRRTGLIGRAIEAAVGFFFGVDPATASFPGHRKGVPDERWWQFKFPDFYAADILKVAEALTALGYGGDPRLAHTLDLIRGMQDENGRWALDYVKPGYKMWVNYGRVGQPNKWVTLRALRVLKQAAQQGWRGN